MDFIKRHKYKLFFFFIFVIFILSFSNNILRVTDDNYRSFDRVDELFIINRLQVSQLESPFAYSGLVGNTHYSAYLEENGTITPLELEKDEKGEYDLGAKIALDYDDYLAQRIPHDMVYSPYLSHPGGQAMLYSLIQEILPVNNPLKLLIFRMISILLSALILSLFLVWLYRNYNLTIALITFVQLALIPIIILFSYNLWWAFWSYYIPFITMLLVLESRKSKGIAMFDHKLLVYMLITCFLKVFFTGFEFITSTLVMSICPIIYYLILEKADRKGGIIYFLKSSLAALLGVVLGALLLLTQIRFYSGSWQSAVDHIADAFARRSLYDENVDKIDFSLPDVFEFFAVRDVYRLDYNTDITISYGTLFLIITLLCIALYLFRNRIGEMKERKNVSLILISLVAILGPLSWIVIFAQHAMFHSLDIVVMYMPYCLFGFAVIGLAIDIAVKAIRQKAAS